MTTEHAPTALYPGDHLDRYELLCPLAQGGMAAVWLARLHGKHGFQKLFAVKFILPQFAEDVRFQRMFLDEARIASGIAHPFVANILDLGEERGILYIVMDWIDGDSLSKLVSSVGRQRQRIPANIAVRIAADVSGALHAAHELHDSDGNSLGVVHRDVSLSNVILTTKGSPKVIDFGIAKAVVRLTQETGAGLMKGKVMYMAPEQAMGKQVDRRADVWAVAAVLHTMLSGDPPYTGDNEMAILHRLTSGGIPNALPLTVPANVRAILKAAMSFDRNARTATCADLQASLEAALVENGTPTTAADVAAYSGMYLEAAAAHRHEMVRAALDVASTRQSMRPQTGAGGSLTPPGPHQADRSSKTPGQPFPFRPSTGRNPLPMPESMSTPSISGPSLTTAPTSGPSASDPPRRGVAMFAAGTVAACALALTSWVLLRSRGHESASASQAMMTQQSSQSSRDPQFAGDGGAGMAPPLAVEAAPVQASAPVAPSTANAPTVMRLAPGVAAAPGPASVPAPAHARTGGGGMLSAPSPAEAPAAPAAPAAPVSNAPPPPPLPVIAVAVAVAAPVPSPAAVAPAPAPPPQAAFVPDGGKVTVARVDVERVSARSVNGLLRHVSLDRCYVSALRARGSAAAGTAVLVLDIDQNQVSRAHLEGNLGMPGMGECIASQFASLRVDDADTGSATARITLSFATP